MEERPQQLLGSVSVLDVRGQYQGQQNESHRIDQEVALAPVDFLAGIVASLVAALRALDALSVEDPRTGMALSPRHHTQMLSQMPVDCHQESFAFPLPEVVIDRTPRRKVFRQIAPLAGGLGQVEDRIEQFPVAMLPGTSGPERFGKAVVNEFPFGVGEIASVSHPQSAGVSDQKSTVNSENFFRFVEFSNTLLGLVVQSDLRTGLDYEIFPLRHGTLDVLR
jgi:hypothetical protein